MSIPASIPHASSTPFNPFYARWSNAPLPGESEEQVTIRVKSLHEAIKRSKEIDESLLQTKIVLEQRNKAVKILLLGARLTDLRNKLKLSSMYRSIRKRQGMFSQCMEQDSCQLI